MTIARVVIVALFYCAAACGPVESTSLRWQVERSIDRASKLGAERNAPYEITSARRYLKKGKEEAGYSDYEAAIDLFHKAQGFAKQAVEKAEATVRMRPKSEENREPPPPPRRRKGRR